MLIAAYFAIAAGLVFIIQFIIFKVFAAKNVTYERSYSTTAVFAGETFDMTERIVNKKLLPLPWIRVESQTGPYLHYIAPKKNDDGSFAFGEHNSVFSLAPYSSVTRRYRMMCEKRGYYALRVAALSYSDLFGIAPVSVKEVPIDAIITVYPRVPDFTELPNLSKNLMGDTVVRRWISEDPFMLRGVREYTPSDPMNRINWKASARTGNLMVHDYDCTSDIKLLIYLNIEPDEYRQDAADPRCIEEAIEQLASIMQYAAENGIETAFASNARSSYAEKVRTDYGTGQAHLTELLTQLAALGDTSRLSFSKFLDEEIVAGTSGTGILVATAYIDDRTSKNLDELRSMGNLVEVMRLRRYTYTRGSDELNRKVERERLWREATGGKGGWMDDEYESEQTV